mgnify:FL=1
MPLSIDHINWLVLRAPDVSLKFAVMEYLRENCIPADVLFFLNILDRIVQEDKRIDTTKFCADLGEFVENLRDKIDTV